MKLIILDRDGVINQDSEHFIKSPDEWIPLDGSLAAIAKLQQAGYTIAVATNQSGVGRGLYDEETLFAIHQKMQLLLKPLDVAIDFIAYCPHKPEDGCDCRKPKAGLFEQIAKHYQIDLNNVPTIGDSLRDLQAGVAAGCQPILVRTGNGKKTEVHPDLPEHTLIFNDLAQACDYLTSTP